MNRLVLERSPYLLQHAHNPVAWYSWGDEAFERAKKENKPVLLSVGYSTCHWCHVMEKESFEDEEIARYMNEHYVSIKVDRERRPDVDGVYMAAVNALTGGGGWPMTVWLTPDRKPFYGGTYFPARDGDRGERIGFLTLLKRLSAIYEESPEQVAASAEQITSHLQRALGSSTSGVSSPNLGASADEAFSQLGSSFDEKYGGFGRAPKFPRSVTLEFLLRYHRRTGNEKAGTMVVKTLEAMARGGMYDQVGGGVHRYSTDARWLVPHFEKMLYDNALLVVAYLEAYQATGRDDFARVGSEILRYVSREVTSPDGGFYSATDADSEGEEGKFFVWTPKEVEKILGPKRASWFNAYYGVTKEGNFEHGTSILHVAATLEEIAKRFGKEPDELRAELERAREQLYEVRKKRVPPLRDDKILVSWNGLMISAFARAAQTLGEPEYAKRAATAAEFILTKMRAGGRLNRSWFEGRAEGTGYLDDYAFLAQGLLDLYESTFEPRWLAESIALHDVIENHFRDAKDGGFFMTPDDSEGLLAREKPEYDG
ncbi:MAG: thioredoxin domain-containing protein, partial [Candidatus Binatia bacterium]